MFLILKTFCWFGKLTSITFFNQKVKQIMEEAVTRKFVHQDSSSVTSLCGMFTWYILHLRVIITNGAFVPLLHHYSSRLSLAEVTFFADVTLAEIANTYGCTTCKELCICLKSEITDQRASYST